MILISTHQLKKSFAGKTLFDGVSFGIEERERVGLVGPNGSGKSTLMKILADREDVDGGTVSRKRGLRVGFLEQTPSFAPDARLLDTILEKAPNKDDAMYEAIELMTRMNLHQWENDFPVQKLSGGWQKRVALAREILINPELLMLDEPTNHLDVSSILWLEQYLSSAPFSLLMITHDRLFLQRVADRILDLDPRNPNNLLDVRGDYTQYLETKELELASLKRHERVQHNKLRRETEWLRRGAKARQTKQQARIQSAHALKEEAEALSEKVQKKSVGLEFGDTDRAPKKLIEAIGLSKGFGEVSLFKDLDLLIARNSRIALLGDNGTGKSTLIRLLLGKEKPDSGQVKITDDIEIAYFEQSRETLDPEKSVLANICPKGDYVHFQGQFIHVRSYLDRFLFSGIKVDQLVRKLSGGEQARLRLAQLMLKPCQLLILDEPTNDLDSDTLDVLEESLNAFNGAIILVTHDRYFMDSVAQEILAFPTKDMAAQGLQKFSSYFQWETWFNEEQKASKKKGGNDNSTKATPSGSNSSPKSRLSYKEKLELENMEPSIMKIESEIAELTVLSQSESVMNDHKKLAETLAKLSDLQLQLEKKYQRWSELAVLQ